MIFALQDEPERGRRLLILGLGAVVASLVWGGGIFAASRYQPPERPKNTIIRMRVIKQPPPKPAAPETVAPPTAPPEAPKTQAPRTEAPKPKPKPKKRRPRPKKKIEPPKPKTPPPAAPTTAPPKPAPVQLGMTMDSTNAKGRGPAVQVGNQFGGNDRGKAKAPVDGPAPGGDRLQEGRPDPVRVGAKVKRKVRPKYTRAALRAGVEGKIIALVTIGADGRVEKARLLEGLGYGLDEKALDALKQWVFRPATVDGRPVRVTKRLKVDFVIED